MSNYDKLYVYIIHIDVCVCVYLPENIAWNKITDS